MVKNGQIVVVEDMELERLLPEHNEDSLVQNQTKPSDSSNKKLKSTKKSFPFSIVFILGNEFCERYSYYGMRTILVLYLKYYLLWDDNTATAVYHAFTVLAYLFPLLGAMLADSWWGKYNTILWLSVVYSIGMIINTLGAIGDLGDHTVHAVLSSIGLLVIAFGTGGIKPCVSAFGGDQFDTDQDEYRRSFFSLFYFAINAGSLISTFVSPLIREEVQCFGDDCYALAFGIPAALMVIAIISFVFGTRWYKRNPPTGNVFLEVSKTIGIAVRNRWRTSGSARTKEHWLDYANNGKNAIMIRDIKYVLNVLVLYIPLPLFWTLFDQQGSRWTLQAVRMDGYVGTLRVLPDQMQICNPLIIVTLIPLFEVTLYPCLKKLNINFSPLRRMTVGMFLACISFIVAALVQMMIDENLTLVPRNMQQTSLRVINSADCNLMFSSDVYPEWSDNQIEGSAIDDAILLPGMTTNTKEQMTSPGEYSMQYRCDGMQTYTESIILSGKVPFDFIVSDDGNGGLKSFLTPHKTEKSDNGGAYVGVMNALNVPAKIDNIDIASNEKKEVGDIHGHKKVLNLLISAGGINVTRNYTVHTGGLYTIVVRDANANNQMLTEEDIVIENYIDIYYNDVNIFWMIPQYFVITLGEVFLSVTGLEFSYSQAPPSMKSVLTSFWLLTVSIGNIIVLIVAEARLIPSQADEYFLFAGLIGIAVILFIILAVRYEYVDESEFAETEDHVEDETSLVKDDLGKVNSGFDFNTEM